MTEELVTLTVDSFGSVPKDFTGNVKHSNMGMFRLKDGVFHCENGPAVEYLNGSKSWFVNGKRHREDGPAIVYAGGARSEYYLNGEQCSEHGFRQKQGLLEAVPVSDEPQLRVLALGTNEKPPINFTGIITWSDGMKSWSKNGLLHRADGPAVEYANGKKSWWLNGNAYSEAAWKKEHAKSKIVNVYSRAKIPAGFSGVASLPDMKEEHYLNGHLHREGGPARIGLDGTNSWWLNDKRHREDGPAIEWADGSKEWYLNGKLHRVGGPAIERANGSKDWKLNGLSHREDGPAIEDLNGFRQWFLNGKPYSEKDWKKEVDMLNAKATEEVKNKPVVLKLKSGQGVPLDFTGIIEHANGTKSWWLNGERHRADGPAVECSDGRKEWCLNGKLHREDGPAIEWANGRKEWWVDGKIYSEEDWKNKIQQSIANEPKEVHTISVKHHSEIPDMFTGVIRWADSGKKEWLKDGYLHREDGPAIQYMDGTREWWLNGLDFASEEDWKAAMAPKLVTTIKSDAKEVAKRIAVIKLTELVSKMAVAGLKTPSKATANKMATFLSTDNGKALMGLVVGMALPSVKEAMPSKYNTVLEDVATEFRVQSETVILTKLVDNVIPTVHKLMKFGAGEVIDPEMFRVSVDNVVDNVRCLGEGSKTEQNFAEEPKEKVPYLRLVKG